MTQTESRGLLTSWLKTGLALSRQLEEFNGSETKIETEIPLLTIKSFAIHFNEKLGDYTAQINSLKKSFYRGIIEEANIKLISLNSEVNKLMHSRSDQEFRTIIAKAFKTAVNASAYLFRNNHKETQQSERLVENWTDEDNSAQIQPTN